MENSYRNCYYRGDGDFEESEVWDVEARQYSIPDVSDEKITCALKHTPSPAKTIPADGGRWTSQSSPVNIPNWTHVGSSVGRLKSSNLGSSCCKRDDYEDDDDDVKMLPPHEYISLRLARSNISCFSVLEGVGRKLKGRDLCKVRNHVLTKTGFLEASSSMS